MDEELKFGFLPAHVLHSIDDLGNWKNRSLAIEQVQQGLLSLGDKGPLLDQLPEFVDFVVQLLQDHNFKVATAGLNILADLAATCGALLQSQLSVLAPALHDKLLDPREVVTAAAVKACGNLMSCCLPSSPTPLLSRLMQLVQQGRNDRHAAPQFDVSGILELLILAQLSYHVSKLDMSAAAEALITGLASRSPKQQALALEGLALATDALGPQLPQLLRQAGAAEVDITSILQRTGKLQRPALSADGTVRHGAEVQAAAAVSRDGTAAEGGVMDFSIKAYRNSAGGSRTFAATDGGDASDLCLSKFAALKLQSDSTLTSISSSASPPVSPKSKLIWTAPVGGGSLGRPAAAGLSGEAYRPQLHQDEQLLPPGSLSTLAAHAQLIQHASTMGGALASSGGDAANAARRTASLPSRYDLADLSAQSANSSIVAGSIPQLAIAEGSPVSSLRGAPGGWDVTGYGGLRTSSGRPRRSSVECHEDLAAAAATGTANGGSCSLQSSLRTSVGSSSSIAAAAAAATGAGNGGSLNSSLNSSLRSSIGLPSTTTAAQSKLDLPKSRFFGEEPCIEQQQGGRIVSSSQHFTNTTSEGPGTITLGQQGSSNSRYDQQQQHLSSSNPMRHLNWSFGRDNCQGVGGVLQETKAPTANSPEPSYASPSARPAPPAAPNQLIANGGGNSSWWAAGAAGWAQAEGQDVNGESASGRPETLSPTRGERLAQLKRRQNEKRGSSAAGGSRPDLHDYSPSPDCSPSHASGQAAAAATLISSLPATAARSSYAEGGIGSTCAGPGLPETWAFASGYDQADSLSNGSGSSRGGGYEAVAATGSVPQSLLKWNLQTAPDGRSSVRQQCQQQQVPASSLVHLHSLPAGVSLEPGAGSLMGRVPAGNTNVGGCIRTAPLAQRSSSDLAAIGRSGVLPLSATTAEMPPYSPSSSRCAVSAAAVLTGTCTGGTDNSTTGGGGNTSPTIRQRRLGAGGGLGLQQPVSASPEYPGANKSSAASRQATGSPAFGAAGSPAQLRAQTAAAAVGLTADWAAAGFGSGHGSPSAGTGSPVSRRGSVFDRPQSVGPESFDISGDLAPLPDPEASVRQTITKLQQSNTAARKELDWQGQLEALIDARRLVAHHLEVLGPAAHELVLAALPAVEELRSTTARMALLLFQELPAVLGRGLERDLDEVVPVLLKKAGELSTAGRDNFLASEADKALSALWAAVSESRALTALMASGLQHKSPHVRCRAAAHLDEVAAGGAGLEGLVRGNWSLLERVFKAAAAFLQEGSLDTRTYGKRLLWAVKAAVRSNRADLDRLLAAVTPNAVQRRVIEVVEGLSAAPPPPPSRGGAAGMNSRGSSRGPAVQGTPTSAHHTSSSSLSSPVTPNSGFGAAAATPTPQGSASRAITSTGSNNSRARRQLLPSGSTSNNSTDSASSKLHVQGAGAVAGGSNSTFDSSVRRRSRSTAEGATGANSSGSGASGPTPAAPPGPPGPMSPELQEAVEQVGTHLASKDWRSRSDALCALSALLPALPEVPNGPLEELLNGVVARLSDGNAKVNVQALQVLIEVLGTVEARILLVMPNLAPALAANLGSANERVRSFAAAVMDALVAVVQPGVLLQSLSHIVMHSSNARAKLILVEKLTGLSPLVYRYQPQVVVKQLLPTAFALALDARGDLRQPAAQLLGVLARLMGPATLLNHAACVSSAVESKVRDLLPTDWA